MTDHEELIDDLECVIAETHELGVTDRKYAVNVVSFLEREKLLSDAEELSRLRDENARLREACGDAKRALKTSLELCSDIDRREAGGGFVVITAGRRQYFAETIGTLNAALTQETGQ